MDGVISQSDRQYLEVLLKYNKTLQQRNTLLKYFAANNTFDPTTLSIYNEQLDDYGTEIFEKRTAFIEEFIPIFKEQYLAISGGKEEVKLQYDSKLYTNRSLRLI